MRGTQKGIRQKPGQVLRIPLGDGTYGYCQMVDKTKHVFFDFKDNGANTNIDDFLKSERIFKCVVDSYIINKGFWEILDVFPISEKHLIFEPRFSYNPFSKTYQIFKDGIGDVPARWEEVQDMEPFCSWGHKAVEQRLKDHFAGRPCYFIEKDRNKHRQDFPDIFTFYKQYGYEFKLDEED